MSFQALNLLAAVFLAQGTDETRWQMPREGPSDGECVLGREISQGGRTLSINKVLGNDEAGVSIEDPNQPVRHTEYKNVQVTLDNGWSGVGYGASGSTMNANVSLLHVSITDPQFIEHLGTAKSIALSHPKLESIRIALGSDGLPIGTIEACNDDRLSKLGIDPGSWRSRPKPVPLIPTASTVSGQDYTPKMIRRNLGGTAPVVLTVGTDGRVKACRPLSNEIDRELNVTTCRVLTGRTRFKPAVDGNGVPVESEYFVAITYRIS